MKFHRLLSFQLDFQLQTLVLALETGCLDRDSMFFVPNIGAMVFLG
jgi:hypothetical protein